MNEFYNFVKYNPEIIWFSGIVILSVLSTFIYAFTNISKSTYKILITFSCLWIFLAMIAGAVILLSPIILPSYGFYKLACFIKNNRNNKLTKLIN